MTPEQILEQALQLLTDGTTVFYATALIVLVVQVLKRIPQLNRFSSGTLFLAVQIVFWIGHTLTTHFGYGKEFQNIIELVTPFLEALLPMLTSILGGTGVYRLASHFNVPGVGYSRSDAETLKVQNAPDKF